jgi:hypothetical protein
MMSEELLVEKEEYREQSRLSLFNNDAIILESASS